VLQDRTLSGDRGAALLPLSFAAARETVDEHAITAVTIGMAAMHDAWLRRQPLTNARRTNAALVMGMRSRSRS
jgi:hypothetical protein